MAHRVVSVVPSWSKKGAFDVVTCAFDGTITSTLVCILRGEDVSAVLKKNCWVQQGTFCEFCGGPTPCLADN